MFRKHKWLLLAASLMLAVGLLAGCGGSGDGGEGGSGDSVTIGFLGPLTGANASEGAAARNAFQMVFDELNASGELPYHCLLYTSWFGVFHR